MINPELRASDILFPRVNAKYYTELYGVKVGSPNSPFKTDTSHLARFVVQDLAPLIIYRDSIHLSRITSQHGRSFEISGGLGESIVKKILWQDEYGNYFLAHNTKGNDLTNPHALRSNISPSGFMYWGLQDSDSILRLLKASELLRSHGADTELVVNLIEPQEFPIKGQNLSQQEFKNFIKARAWEENKPFNGEVGKERWNVTRKDIPHFARQLDKTTFFITVRGMLVNERISDLLNLEREEDFKEMLRNIFESINIVERLKARKDPQYTPYSFSVENEQDIWNYFCNYLPQRAGASLSKFHNLELLHKYPTVANITASGAVVDLDSVVGQALGLGDNPVEKQMLIAEAKEVFNGYIKVLTNLNKKGFLKLSQETITLSSGKKYSYSPDLIKVPTYCFLSYLQNRNTDGLDILKAFVEDNPYAGRGIREFLRDYPAEAEAVLDKLGPEISWDFTSDLPHQYIFSELYQTLLGIKLPYFTEQDGLEVMHKFFNAALEDPELLGLLGDHINTLVRHEFFNSQNQRLADLTSRFGEKFVKVLAELYITRSTIIYLSEYLNFLIDHAHTREEIEKLAVATQKILGNSYRLVHTN